MPWHTDGHRLASLVGQEELEGRSGPAETIRQGDQDGAETRQEGKNGGLSGRGGTLAVAGERRV
jgi:hypothetical protein